MKVPKAKSRTVNSFNLSNWDGVKDVKIGRAAVEAREDGNAHVTGKGFQDTDAKHEDAEERRKRYGFLY